MRTFMPEHKVVLLVARFGNPVRAAPALRAGLPFGPKEPDSSLHSTGESSRSGACSGPLSLAHLVLGCVRVTHSLLLLQVLSRRKSSLPEPHTWLSKNGPTLMLYSGFGNNPFGKRCSQFLHRLKTVVPLRENIMGRKTMPCRSMLSSINPSFPNN